MHSTNRTENGNNSQKFHYRMVSDNGQDLSQWIISKLLYHVHITSRHRPSSPSMLSFCLCSMEGFASLGIGALSLRKGSSSLTALYDLEQESKDR